MRPMYSAAIQSNFRMDSIDHCMIMTNNELSSRNPDIQEDHYSSDESGTTVAIENVTNLTDADHQQSIKDAGKKHLESPSISP